MDAILIWVFEFVVEALFYAVAEGIVFVITRVLIEITEIFSTSISEKQWWFLFALLSAIGLSLTFTIRNYPGLLY